MNTQHPDIPPKTCARCGHVGPADKDFGINRSLKDGRSTVCKACIREESQARALLPERQTWLEKNRKILRDRAKAKYEEDPEVIAKKLARAAHKSSESDRYQEKLARNRAKTAAAALLPEAVERKRAQAEESARRRRDRQKLKSKSNRAAHPAPSQEKRRKKVAWKKWAEFDPYYLEAQRLTRETGVQHDVEHIFPVISDWVCGLHTPDNLRVCTRSEKLKKSNRPCSIVSGELWDPEHYSIYTPGDVLTLKQKQRAAEAPGRAAAAKTRRDVRKEEKARKMGAIRSLPKAPQGRKGMTKERAATMPAVQELLKGRAIREVSREFGKNSAAITRYARIVDPSYVSPFHKHGRAQPTPKVDTAPPLRGVLGRM